MATSEPSPRLFARGPCTDDRWLYCGGPELLDAMSGLNNILEDAVECLLFNGDDDMIELKVKKMTDEEVEQIPEE